ncbi:uncharacterized protein [Magallana gigas]|uniref:uncharacterized protein n=1 Tax=Magallana gigas TaxID=29159 RepID=UPI00333E8116
MENYPAHTTQPNRWIKTETMKTIHCIEVLGWMSPVNKQYQTQLMNTNNSSSQVEPDLKEVQKYVDNIIKGAIEKVKEEKSSKPFKNKVGPTMPDDLENRDKEQKRRSFKARMLSLFTCCFRKPEE